MNYDKYTYGKAPAAMYLVLLLNERGDAKLARKVTRYLAENRRLMNEVVSAHMNTQELTTTVFGQLVAMIKTRIRSDENRFGDPFIADLARNILIGELRIHEGRVRRAAQLQQHVARGTPNGKTVVEMKAGPASHDESEAERNLRLQAKSREYLVRKGKQNTLY